MAKSPLDVIGASDHELLDEINRTRDLALNDGALPRKQKLLIALALDAGHGSVSGVRNLTLQALKQGATKAEIMEALRVAHYICGVGSIYTAAAALDEIW